MNNTTKLIISILTFLLSISGTLYFGSNIGKIKFTVFTVFILFVLFGTFWIIWLMVNQSLNKTVLSNSLAINETCQFKDKPCCGYKTFESLNNSYQLIPNVDLKSKINNEFSLYLQNDMIEEKEKDFKSKNGKEIWIVSLDLNSEIKGGASNLVKNNIAAGIKYVYFYAKNEDKKQIIEQNKAELIKDIKTNKPRFFSYGNEKKLDNYLFYLFGIVIYIKDDGSYDAYFSIRKEYDTIPIYYKMPNRCMATKYYGILKEIQKQK